MSLQCTNDLDRISHGTAPNVALGNAYTLCCWARPTDLTTVARRVIDICKQAGAPQTSLLFTQNTTDNLQAADSRVTTGLALRSANSFAATNVWQFFAVVADSTIPGVARLYRGTETVACVEPTYLIQTVPVGSRTFDADAPLCVGSRQFGNNSFRGQVAFAAAYNRVLSQAELQQTQFQLLPLAGCLVHSVYFHLPNGFARDMSGSGNHGTLVQGAVSALEPLPVLALRGRMKRKQEAA